MSRRFRDWVERDTWVTFILFEAICALFVVVAFLDATLGVVGWGFGWAEFVASIGMGLFGCLVYGVCRIIFGLVDRTGL